MDRRFSPGEERMQDSRWAAILTISFRCGKFREDGWGKDLPQRAPKKRREHRKKVQKNQREAFVFHFAFLLLLFTFAFLLFNALYGTPDAQK
jgi:hypothetical protein